MTWRVRLDIALQTALAMEYLHLSITPPVVHRDITSSNIFVERDMRIKVGDFGLSRLLVYSETTVSSAVDQRREKRDMALAELFVSKLQMGLLDQVVDPLLAGGEEEDEGGVAAVAELAFRCVAVDKDDRPDAKEIVGELRRIKSRTRLKSKPSYRTRRM
ncbi:Protein kinase superfamily protein [Raphanus sativus]|nr:Protein kinase superfamily protein [Raphanus sativus]